MTCPSCAAETGPSSVCAACGGSVEPPGLAPGAVIAHRYEIQGRLGAGGMGVVYKARDRLLEEIVALKVLRRDTAGSDEMARRFRSEIRLARAVSHRNVCRIHEYGEEGDLRYVSMALLDGVDLRQMLRERGRFSGEETVSHTVQIAAALEAIHAEGIVHRDLKPGNVMVDGRGVTRVMDFGIAKQWESAAADGMTGTGMLIGTPTYMSPEQIRGEKLDGRSDLYSLGVVVFELATGRTPFRGETPMAVLFQHVNEPPPLHGPEAAMIPPSIVAVLERALSKVREQRFATAGEMGDALARAGRECAAATPPSTETMARPPLSRRPAPAAARSATTARAAVTEVPEATVSGVEVRSDLAATSVTPARSRRAWLLAATGAAVVVVAAITVLVSRTSAPTPTPDPATTMASPAAGGAGPPPSVRTVPVTTFPALDAPAAGSAAVPTPKGSARAAAALTPSPPPEVHISSAAAMAGLLAEADAALGDHALELAGSLYDQALASDPASEKARAGRARVAEALAIPAGPAVRPRRFVSGQTRVDSAAAVSGPAGFDGSAGLPIRRIEQTQSPAGKISFEVSPPAVVPGQPYVVRTYLVNESGSPIEVGEVTATTTVNGRRSGGRVETRVRQLLPGQKTVLLEAQDVWRTEATTWALAVTVRTPRGESYTNQITWE